jgi:predicted MFS family arabinose efflux permease
VALYAAAADGRTTTRRQQTTTTDEARRLATRDVAALSIFGQVVTVTAAATLVESPQTMMVAVVVSCVFLYAFVVAYVELQQQLVAEGDRNAVQGCEAALTGAAELGLAGVALAYAANFEVVADVSTTAVVAAGLVFAGFLARQPEVVSRPAPSSSR